jgi:glycosyltransferase involved in cell wall biosynthesis
MIADIFITTKNRPDLLRESLKSLFACTDSKNVRVTLVRDGDYKETRFVEDEFAGKLDYILTSYNNEGLGPAINMALAHIDTLNKWWDHPTHGDLNKVAPFIVYCQDDLLYVPQWLEKLTRSFLVLNKREKIGFASGLECVEHEVREQLLGGMVLKDWNDLSPADKESWWKVLAPDERPVDLVQCKELLVLQRRGQELAGRVVAAAGLLRHGTGLG